MKISATVMPSQRIGHLDPERLEVAADPPVRGVERGERDARHRRGQRERQVHHRIHQPAPGKPVAHQHPGHQQAEDRVDQRRDERGAEGHPVGGQHARVGDGAPELGPGKVGRAREHGGEREQHHETEVGAGDPQAQTEPGEHAPRGLPHRHPFVGVDTQPGLAPRLVDLIEQRPSAKWVACAFFHPPNTSSTVTRFTLGNCAAYLAATAALRGR